MKIDTLSSDQLNPAHWVYSLRSLSNCILSFVLIFFSLSFSVKALAPPTLLFSESEKKWLESHPVIRVGVDPDWAPFSFRNQQGKLQGIDIEILAILSQIMGVKFEVTTKATWEGVIHSAIQGDFDLLSSTALSPKRENNFLFSEPYYRSPSALISRQDQPFIINLNQLNGKVVATPREHVITEMLQRDYQDINLLFTSSAAESLKAVSVGKAEATVVKLVHASYVIREMGLTNLKISGIMDQHFDLRFAINQDSPELKSILDKAILSLPRQEVAGILNKWILVDREKWITWHFMHTYIFGGLAVVLLVGTLLILGNFFQRREITRRQKIEAELKAAHDRLAKLNYDKNEMMQMVAHDIRNPLTGIIIGADVMRMEIDEKISPSIMSNLDDIIMLSIRIQKMLEQLVTVTALECGHQTLKIEKLDPIEIAQRIVEAQRKQAANKKITINTFYPEQSWAVLTDKISFERILENVLSNAIKFSPLNSVIEFSMEFKNEYLIMKVKDQGPGLTEGDKKGLFKKLSRLSARPTAGEESTGLGLAIVKALTNALGGEVRCESLAGEGATFTINLPQTKSF